MKHIRNDVGSICCSGRSDVEASISELCSLIKKHGSLVEPFKGNDSAIISRLQNDGAITPVHTEQDNERISAAASPDLPFSSDRVPLFYAGSFYFFPTVKKTTLIYDKQTDCFMKILHSLTLKHKVMSAFMNRGRSLYNLSQMLTSEDINVPEIHAYGTLRKGRKAFYAMSRIEGNSLFDILVKKREMPPMNVYRNVIDKLARLHNMNYVHGDMRIAHVFLRDAEVSGFVDVDSIHKNRPFSLRRIAKDLAGLNSPGIPLGRDEREALFEYYLRRVRIGNRERLKELVKRYTDQKWNR